MKLKIEKNATLFKHLIRMFSNAGLETKVEFNDTGVKMLTSDGNNCAMKINLTPEFFDVYEPGNEMGIFLSDLNSSIKHMKTITIEEVDNQLLITSDSVKYKLPIIENPTTIPDLPGIELKFKQMITFSHLFSALNILTTISKEQAELKVSEDNKFTMRAKDGLKEVEYMVIDNTNTNYPCKSYFSIKYLSYIALDSTDSILMELDDNKPVRFIFSTDNVRMEYMIAPRVDAF